MLAAWLLTGVADAAPPAAAAAAAASSVPAPSSLDCGLLIISVSSGSSPACPIPTFAIERLAARRTGGCCWW